MKTYQITLFITCLIANVGFSQPNKIDSLTQIIKQAKHDTTRCFALITIGEQYYYRNPDSALIVLEKAESLAKFNIGKEKTEQIVYRFKLWLAYALNLKGYVYNAKGESKSALNVFKESLKISEQINDKSGVATCYVNIGEIAFNKGDILASLENHHKGLKLFLELKELGGMAAAYGNLGEVYKEQGDFINALEYTQKALLAYEQTKDPLGIPGTLSNIGIMYKENGDPNCKGDKAERKKLSLAKALEYLLRALKKYEEIKDTQGIGRTLNNIGTIYKEQGDITKGLDYLQKAVKLLEGTDNKTVIAAALANVADMLNDKGEVDAALNYAKQSFKITKELAYPSLIKTAATILNKIYKKQNKFKEALEMYEISVQMNDSINNSVTRKASVKKQLQIQYEKQAQTDSLANEAKVIKAQLINEQKLNQQRIFTYVGLIGFILMLAIAYISFRAYKNKQKANIIIAEQKLLAENQKQIVELTNKDLERQHLLNQKIFSVISHDFRGPMLSLDILLNTFRKKSKDPLLNNFVSEVNTEVANANEILNNLLNWARTEINIKSFEKTDALVNDVLEDITNELKNKLNAKHVKVISEIPKDTIIQLPPDILKIVLRNLISNAVKYSYINSEIKIIYKGINSFSVKDFGIGIDDEKLKQLFIKEVDTSLGTNNEEGFGIGLYIVSELLYKYGYSISVESEKEKGSVFIITPIK